MTELRYKPSEAEQELTQEQASEYYDAAEKIEVILDIVRKCFQSIRPDLEYCCKVRPNRLWHLFCGIESQLTTASLELDRYKEFLLNYGLTTEEDAEE